MRKILEYKKSDLKPIKSFEIKDELNPEVWDKNKSSKETLNKEIRETLLEIADDYMSTLAFEIEYDDIYLVGSLANYNYSEYSDFDLHILADYKKINSDVKLVEAYLDLHKKSWNDKYDIKIKGYDVELYVQDTSETFHSNGIYSILNDKWIKYPSKINMKIDKEEIEKKSIDIMEIVDDLEKQLKNGNLDEVHAKVGKVWDRIKKYRSEGLETDAEELSVGNLVFKMLRRNGYIGKIIDIKKRIKEAQYDK